MISGSLIIVVHPHITQTATTPSQIFSQSSFCFSALFLSHASLLYPHSGSCEVVCLRNPLETSILITPLYTPCTSVHLGIQVCCYRMKSLSEAEEFLGIEFPKNELIERRSGNGPNVYMEAYNRNGEWESGKVNCYVMLANDEEGNLESTITSAFFYGNIDVRYIVDAGEDEKWGTGTGWGTEGVSSEKEIYRNSAGIDFRIVQNVREYGCDFAAYAAINGVLTEVKYFTAYAENGEYGYEPLKLILEGYVQ